MIGPMPLRGHGASRPTAAAGSLRRGARIAVAALVLALAGCSAGERSGAPLVRLDVGQNLGALTVAGGDVWVNDFGREELVRVDGRTGRVLGRLRGGRRIALASDSRSVWALRWGGRFFRTPNGPLYRIDSRSGRVLERLPLRGPSGVSMIGFGVIAGGGDLWVWGPDRVLQLEASSGRPLRDFGVVGPYGELTGVAPDGAGGLLATTGDGHLASIDAAGIVLRRAEPALFGAQLQVVVDGRAVASRGGGVLAVDADRGRLLWRRPLGFRVSTILPHAGVLLVHGAAFRDEGDRLWALDPATGRLLASTTIPSFGTTGMALAADSLWFTTAAGELIVAPPLLVRLFLATARVAP
jgi:outer membrane protein assembly factor BamB